MSDLPLPPAPVVLRGRGFTGRLVPAGTRLWRVHPVAGSHVLPWDVAREYGPVGRLDPHPLPVGLHPGVGVLYAATSLGTCLAEVFQGDRVIPLTSGEWYATSWRTTRDLSLVDVQGAAALRLGAADSLNGDARRDVTAAWARAIATAWPDAEGLWHRSAMDGGDCVCLWRGPQADGTSALPSTPALSRPLGAGSLGRAVVDAARRVGYTVR